MLGVDVARDGVFDKLDCITSGRYCMGIFNPVCLL